jgi:hypothetical protein
MVERLLNQPMGEPIVKDRERQRGKTVEDSYLLVM